MITEVPEIASAFDSDVYPRLYLEASNAKNYKVLYMANAESDEDVASQPERNLVTQMHELVARYEKVEKCEGGLRRLFRKIWFRHSLRTAFKT
jgi:hypothetical protein